MDSRKSILQKDEQNPNEYEIELEPEQPHALTDS